jgi:O-antigen/teichoic acid export membrane protein
MFTLRDLNFSIIKYFNYLIMGIRGFVVAKIVGPELLGVYSLFVLYQQYFMYSNIGVQYSLSIELSKIQNNSFAQKSYIGSALFINVISGVGLILLFLFLYSFNINLFPIENKFFVIFLFLIVILSNLQELFINILRINNQVYLVAIIEFILSCILLLVVFLSNKDNLVETIILTTFMTLIFSNSIFLINLGKIQFSLLYVRKLFFISIPVLLYHFSYNLFLLGTRSYISYFYPLSILGNFSFALNIVTIYLLLFNSLTWLAYPRVVKELSNVDSLPNDIKNYMLYLLKKIFILQLFLTLCAYISSPFVFYFFAKYELASNFFYILLFTNFYAGLTFPIVTFYLSRNNYWSLICYSFLSLSLGCVFFVINYYFSLDIVWVLISYFLVLVTYFNLLVFGINKHFKFSKFQGNVLYIFELQLLILLPTILVLFHLYYISFLTVLIICILYYKEYINLYKTLLLNKNLN